MCLTGIQAGKRIHHGDLALKLKVKRRDKEIMKELFNDERGGAVGEGGRNERHFSCLQAKGHQILSSEHSNAVRIAKISSSLGPGSDFSPAFAVVSPLRWTFA